MRDKTNGSHFLNRPNWNNREIHRMLDVSGHEKVSYESINSLLGRIFQEDNNRKEKVCFGMKKEDNIKKLIEGKK